MKWLEEERDYLFNALKKFDGIKVYPPAVNFMLLRLPSEWGNAPSFCLKMRECGILVRDCSNYPGLDDTYIRVAVRNREDNNILLQTISKIGGRRG